MKQQTFRSLLKTPSAALQAMVDGLRRHGNRIGFQIDMDTWLKGEGSICFGCAATCTIQKALGKKLSYDNGMIQTDLDDRANIYSWDKTDLWMFETAINDARRGYMSSLFNYFHIPTKQLNKINCAGLPYLNNDNWKTELPKIEKFIKKLQKA